MAKPITHVVNVFSLSDITCFSNFVLFPTLFVWLAALLSCFQAWFGPQPKKKKKNAPQAVSLQTPLLWHVADRHYNQKQNIINLKTESPALASSIIPRFINQN